MFEEPDRYFFFSLEGCACRARTRSLMQSRSNSAKAARGSALNSELAKNSWISVAMQSQTRMAAGFSEVIDREEPLVAPAPYIPNAQLLSIRFRSELIHSAAYGSKRTLHVASAWVMSGKCTRKLAIGQFLVTRDRPSRHRGFAAYAANPSLAAFLNDLNIRVAGHCEEFAMLINTQERHTRS